MRSAMSAASQLSGRRPTDVDDLPAPALYQKSDYDMMMMLSAHLTLSHLNIMLYNVKINLGPSFEHTLKGQSCQGKGDWHNSFRDEDTLIVFTIVHFSHVTWTILL